MPKTKDIKPCGCQAKGLTRAVALWECPDCRHVQFAPRSAKARCEGIVIGANGEPERCQRIKGANPRGQACCGGDVRAGSACPECGRIGEDQGRLPHPEVDYLTDSCERGYFRARDSFLRCCGCLELAPNGMD